MARVLVIDASATSRYVLLKLLQRYNHEVTAAKNAAEALDLLAGRKPGGPYDGVFFGWPLGMDPNSRGVNFLLQLAIKGARGVVIFSSREESAPPDWAQNHASTAVLARDQYPAAIKALHQLLKRPVRAVNTPEEPEKTEANDAPPCDVSILLVDDSPSVRAHYKRLLEQHNYTVEAAFSVEDGLTKAQEGNYDIAIIDYFMPESNGDELVRRLRESPRTQGIISAVLTSSYVEQVIKDTLSAGATECMFKNEAQELFLARVSAMARTVAQRKSIEAERERLAGILCSVEDGVYGVDSDGVITFINPAGQALLGYPETAALVGRKASEVVKVDGEGPGARAGRRMARAYGTDQELRGQETVVVRDGQEPLPVEFTLLPLTVSGNSDGSVVAFRDISVRRSVDEMQWQATHDPLTGLRNRAYLEQALEEDVDAITQGDGLLGALVYADLDNFTELSANIGRDATEDLLAAAASCLRAQLRENDIIARLEGDAFGVILRDVSGDDVSVYADGLRQAVHGTEFQVDDEVYSLRLSAGVVPIDGELSADGLLLLARSTCRSAHESGGNITQLASTGAPSAAGVVARPVVSAAVETEMR